ncbi:glycosyltransferase family 39 protein [Weissella oryzae]|nr:glycosyltransferase family 39 protein [Weissella oryzae]
MTIINKIIRWSLLILFFGAFLSMLLASHTDTTIISSISVITLTIILFLLIRWIYHQLTSFSSKTKGYIIWLAWFSILLIQIIFVFTVHVGVFGDPVQMLQMATRLANHNYDWVEWIRQYPNLVPLTALYTGFLHLSSWTGLPFLAVFYSFNVAVTSAIVGLTFYLIWRHNQNIAVIAAGFAIITPFFYTFLLNVGYSDGPAILISLALALIYDSAEHKGTFKWLAASLTVILFGAAYLMRPNIIILLVAFLLMLLLSFKNRKQNFTFQLNLRMLASSFVGLILASQVSRWLFTIFHYDKNNADVFPTLHWIYMGLNPTSGGKYSTADRYYTLLHHGYKTAAQADWAGILHRFAEYNPITLILHWLAKFFTLWSSGTFQTSTDYQIRWQSAPSFLLNHMLTLDVLNESFTKALIALLLFSIVVKLYRMKKLQVNLMLLVLLFIIGISLFHSLIWEVKIRYQFMTIGLLLFAGYQNLADLIEQPLKFNKFKELTQKNTWALIALPILGGISLLTMNLIPSNHLLSPVSSYRWAQSSIQKQNDHTFIEQGQQISQIVPLGVKSSNLQLVTEYSQPLVLYIDRWQANQWQPVLESKIPAHSLVKNISYPFAAGKYRITLQNNTIYPAEVAVAQKSYTTPNRLLATNPQGDNSTLVFTFWRSSNQRAVYTPTLIGSFTGIIAVTWLMLAYPRWQAFQQVKRKNK